MKQFTQFVAVLMVLCITVNDLMGQIVKTAGRPDQRTAVVNAGVGENAPVTVKLKDGSELRGYVSLVSEMDFEITEQKTLRKKTVPYNQIAAIKSKKSSWDYGVRARKEVAKAGIGPGARISLMSRGTRVNGVVIQAAEETFVVANAKTGEKTTLAYSDVETIHRPKSLAFSIGIGAAVGVALLFLVLASAYLANES